MKHADLVSINALSDRLGKTPTQVTYAGVMNMYASRIDQLVDSMRNEYTPVHTAMSSMEDMFLDMNKKAAIMGATRAKSSASGIELANLIGATSWYDQINHFYRFFEAIRSKDIRYFQDNALLPKPIKRRARLYINRARGTANEAFIKNSPVGTKFSLASSGSGCYFCEAGALMSPQVADELHHVPAVGDSPCSTECSCVVVRMGVTPSDRLSGFSKVQL